jgi:hypothetical protein
MGSASCFATVTLARIVPDFPGLYWNNTDLKTPGDVQLQHKFMHGQLIPLRVLCISVAFFFYPKPLPPPCVYQVLAFP